MNLGDFQGKEASEQRIRELCGGMISGESPVHTLALTLFSLPHLSSDLKEGYPLLST